jgi:molybdopterin-guanine dinucleotide biosynthesis protein A
MSMSMSTIAILAGGGASRMGGLRKSFLVVEGRRIIDRQLAVMRPLFSHIVVVGNDPDRRFAELGLPVVADRVGAGLGPVAGLEAALAWRPTAAATRGLGAEGDGQDPASDDAEADPGGVVCVAGDMPFLTAALLRRLRDHAGGGGVIPLHAGRLEPLCARYPRSAAAAIATFLRAGGRALHELAETLALDRLDEGELQALSPGLPDFTNINYPDDLRRLGS